MKDLFVLAVILVCFAMWINAELPGPAKLYRGKRLRLRIVV